MEKNQELVLANKLYKYQYEIVINELASGRKSHALFMDMGTGKTITSLALHEAHKRDKLLIICPVSKLTDWAEDVEKLLDKDAVILDKGTKKNQTLIRYKAHAFVINFESVWRLESELLELINEDWFIIVDESHKIKSRTSKVGKFMRKLGKKTSYKCILTGTPQSHGYIDYHNQLEFTEILPLTNKEFDDRYCIYGMQEFRGARIRALVGYKRTAELDEIINTKCVFFKREVENELIPSHIDVSIPVTAAFKKFKKDRVLGDVIGDSAGAYQMGLRQLSSGFLKDVVYDTPKLRWLSDFVEEYNERIVIFYNFNTERDMLIKLCEDLKRPWSQYNSQSKDLTSFINEENGIAICNYMSAAQSLNQLTAANTCIFYSPTNDYILFEQAKKRIDRIGQTKKPLLYYIKGSPLENRIYEVLKTGKNFDDKMFENYLQIVNDSI